MGSCNLHKQKISGDDLVKYLAYQSKHFKLTPSSEIKGMEVFQHNARGYDQRFSAPGEDYTQPNATRDETLNDTELHAVYLIPATPFEGLVLVYLLTVIYDVTVTIKIYLVT